jgi:hypothetical protein
MNDGGRREGVAGLRLTWCDRNEINPQLSQIEPDQASVAAIRLEKKPVPWVLHSLQQTVDGYV